MYTCQTSVKFAMNAMCCTNKRICPIYPYIVELTALIGLLVSPNRMILTIICLWNMLINSPFNRRYATSHRHRLWNWMLVHLPCGYSQIYSVHGFFRQCDQTEKKTIKLLFKVENAIIQRARERAAESSWSSCSTNVNQ